MALVKSLLVIVLCPRVSVSESVDTIDYTHIVIKDVLNGSASSSIRDKPNQGNNKFIKTSNVT
jgi:hypothetical protein